MNNQAAATFSFKPIIYLCLLAILLAAILVLPSLIPQAQSDIELPHVNCELSKSGCSNILNNKSMTLSVDADEIRSMRPLNFTLKLDGIDASEIMLDLKGIDMNMGINQSHFIPVTNKEGQWRTTTELAVCVTGTMRWRANVIARTPQGLVSSYFEFDAK